MTCWPKLCCKKFIWKKWGYVNVGAYTAAPPPSNPQPLKICTFSDIKPLRSAWVSDGASLCGSWEWAIAHADLRVLQFFRIWQFISHRFSYFQPCIVKTALVRGYCTLSHIIQVILKPCTGYLLVDKTLWFILC